MTPEELDDTELREALPGHFRTHVIHQSGAGTKAPETIFADADYEFGDGACGLHEDDKRANEPAIVYVRADLFMAERAHAAAALRAQAEVTQERDGLAAEVAELRAIIALMDDHTPRADSACREPGITFSEACRREWKDRMGGDDAQEDTQ